MIARALLLGIAVLTVACGTTEPTTTPTPQSAVTPAQTPTVRATRDPFTNQPTPNAAASSSQPK